MPVTDVLKVSNVLIVPKLDPNIVLLSVRKMRDLDVIYVYFNDDNSTHLADCMRFPSQTIVSFLPGDA